MFARIEAEPCPSCIGCAPTEQAARSELLQSKTGDGPSRLGTRWPPPRLSEPAGVQAVGYCASSEGSVPRPFDDSIGIHPRFRPGIAGWPLADLCVIGRHGNGRDWDIYVQSFPMPGRGKWRVSRNGVPARAGAGTAARSFTTPVDGRLMAVPVISRGTGLEFGTAAPLFDASLLGGLPRGFLKQQYRRRERWAIPAQRAGRTGKRPVVHRRRQLARGLTR